MFVYIILLFSIFFTGGLTITEEQFNYNRTVLEWVFLTNTHNAGWMTDWDDDEIWKDNCARYYRANNRILETDENGYVYPLPGLEPSCTFLLINKRIADPVVFPQHPQYSSTNVDILRCKCEWINTVNGATVNPDDGYFYLTEVSLFGGVTEEEKEYYENHFIYFEMEPTTLPDNSQAYTVRKCWAFDIDD